LILIQIDGNLRVHSHSLTYDHPAYDQLELRPKFPYEYFNSNYYQNVTKISSLTTFQIVCTKCYHNTHYWDNRRTTYL